jgi:hypothetical protein
MIEVRVFRAEDYVEIMQGKGLGNIDALSIGKAYETGVAYSGFCNGKLVAVGGIICPWPGMGEMWAVLNGSTGCVLGLNKAVRRVVAGVVRNMSLRRIQANVDANSKVAIRWAEWIGFKFEGEMPKYGPNGEDFLRYVMFPNGKGESDG